MTESSEMTRLFNGVGQDRLYRKINLICQKGKIGSAYLFAGPAGAGKRHLALHFFAAMNCLNPMETGAACGHCNACKKTLGFSHPNLHLIFALPKAPGKDYSKNVNPVSLLNEKQYGDLQNTLKTFYADPYTPLHVPGANQIIINSIRTIKKDLRLKQDEPGWQFILITLIEKANIQSYNSLLKILEEPPPQTTFILTTEKPYDLPDTIKSRCQIIKFNPVEDKNILEHLKDRGNSEEDARLITRLSNGNMQKIKTYQSAEFSKDKAEFLSLWRDIMGGKMLPINDKIKVLARTVKSDRNGFEDFFRMMMYWFRDAQGLEAGSSPDNLILFQYRYAQGGNKANRVRRQ